MVLKTYLHSKALPMCFSYLIIFLHCFSLRQCFYLSTSVLKRNYSSTVMNCEQSASLLHKRHALSAYVQLMLHICNLVYSVGRITVKECRNPALANEGGQKLSTRRKCQGGMGTAEAKVSLAQL